ncbi:HlyU family transcriptional regulator [Kiloniella sp. EL199]|uniref:HlyU family transcriptional regulator n=1 Tax=Kiloniella sp. EL199 TaxID=2107581 RepID=UPI000EA1E2B3|nr:HlyU family transcriptional regulator [Kiloniella sp. EL199]
MSFFSKLFGRANLDKKETQPSEEPFLYEGYAIIATPDKADNGQWRLSGYIKNVTENPEDIQMERFFLRADTFSSREEAVEFTLRKGRQIIDEQGKRLFADGEPTGRA